MNIQYEGLLNFIRERSAEWSYLLTKAANTKNWSLVEAVSKDINDFNRPTVAVAEDEHLHS